MPVVRPMLEAGIILNKNIAPPIKCVAVFAMTKRSENVLAGSLRGKFYEVENSTAESVRVVPVRMLQFIKSPRKVYEYQKVV